MSASPATAQPLDAAAAIDVTVWYDGSCPLCLREIALMRRLDRNGRVAFIDLSLKNLSLDGAARQAQCPLDRSAMLKRLHALEADGGLLSGAAAFAAMWRAIPALRPLGLLARRPGVLWLLEQFYLGFLRLRPLLQKVARRLDAGILRGPHGA